MMPLGFAALLARIVLLTVMRLKSVSEETLPESSRRFEIDFRKLYG